MTVLRIAVSEDTNFGKTEEEILQGINFADWHFSPDQNPELRKALANVVRSEMAEAIRNSWRWVRPEIEFVSDGVSIYVTMNLGLDCNDGRIWLTASIDEMIDEYLWCTNPDDMDGGDEARTELAKTLRDCASKLEAAVGKNVERKTSPSEQPAWATEWAQRLIDAAVDRLTAKDLTP